MASSLPTPRENVLVVDDDLGVRDVCTAMLRSLGYRAQAVGCGEDALATLSARGIELVLLDLEMPGLSGGELLVALRRRRQGLRVVLMSGCTHVNLERYLSCGADAVLRKPFRLAQLGRSMRGALARQAEPAPTSPSIPP